MLPRRTLLSNAQQAICQTGFCLSIRFAAEAALKSRLPLSLCGEMAGDPRYTALLLGLGLRDLSMASTQLPRVKQRIRGLDLGEATRRAGAIMDQSDSGRIAALLDDFNALA